MAASAFSNAQADEESFVTTWRTLQGDDSITVPVGGTYTIDWGDGTIHANVSGSQRHTYDSPGTYTVSISDGITRFHPYGSAASKLVSLDQWGTAQWTSMHAAFSGAYNMKYNATDAPDLSRVSDISHMFAGASSFDGDLSNWDVSSVTDMSAMFFDTPFDGDLSNWDVSSVTDMAIMFSGTPFDGDLSNWDVSSVTDMSAMFSGASSFDGDLSNWDVSSVTAMAQMFSRASSFDGDLSNWDVSSVTDMSAMFSGASSFDGDLSNWDVSSVTDMAIMFSGTPFDGDLSNWDVSSVTDMSAMFYGASSFNQPLNSWDVSSVTDMSAMFHDALTFEQNLGNWYIVLNDTSIDYGNAPGTVGRISAQNAFLDGQNPTYGIGPGGDSGSFELNGADLVMREVPPKDSYTVTVTATFMGDFGSDNSKTFAIDVSGLPISSPFQQVQSGVPVNEVECAGERVLMVSPSGMPACVYTTSKDTLLQRGFVLAVTYN